MATKHYKRFTIDVHAASPIGLRAREIRFSFARQKGLMNADPLSDEVHIPPLESSDLTPSRTSDDQESIRRLESVSLAELQEPSDFRGRPVRKLYPLGSRPGRLGLAGGIARNQSDVMGILESLVDDEMNASHSRWAQAAGSVTSAACK